MINCFIIDDERAAVNIIKNYVSRVDSLNLLGESIDPQEGLRLVNELKPDLLFLDIQMNKMTGIELASLIKSNTKIIFCTAYSEFAVESYELNAVDYLMKPISFDRFLRAVKRFDDSSGNSVQDNGISGDYIFIQTEQKGKMVRVRFDDIEFI
jgi:two-component SAPR family response regulator